MNFRPSYTLATLGGLIGASVAGLEPNMNFRQVLASGLAGAITGGLSGLLEEQAIGRHVRDATALQFLALKNKKTRLNEEERAIMNGLQQKYHLTFEDLNNPENIYQKVAEKYVDSSGLFANWENITGHSPNIFSSLIQMHLPGVSKVLGMSALGTGLGALANKLVGTSAKLGARHGAMVGALMGLGNLIWPYIAPLPKTKHTAHTKGGIYDGFVK